MEYTITKNHKNFSTLHLLISGGHYQGLIAPNKFKLKRKHFLNNFEIVGTLIENNYFVVVSDFAKPMKYIIKTYNVLGIIISLGLFLIESNWIVGVLYFIVRLISRIYVHIKTENEIEKFARKFLELGNFQ